MFLKARLLVGVVCFLGLLVLLFIHLVCIERVCKKTVEEIQTQEEPVVLHVSPSKKEVVAAKTLRTPIPVVGAMTGKDGAPPEAPVEQPMEVAVSKSATGGVDATARRGDEPMDVSDTHAGDGDASQGNIFDLLLSPEATAINDKAGSPEEEANIRALGASLAAAVGSSLKLNDSGASENSRRNQSENLSGSFLSAPMLVDPEDSDDEIMEVDGDKGKTPTPRTEKDNTDDGAEDVTEVPPKQTSTASAPGSDFVPRHKRISLSRAAVIGKSCMRTIIDEGPIGRMVVTPVVSVVAAAGNAGDESTPASGQSMDAKRPVVRPKVPQVKPDPVVVPIAEKTKEEPSPEVLAQQARNAAQAAAEVDASDLDTPEFRALQQKLDQDRVDGE